MAIATRKLRSPLKWHGGKNYLCRRIIATFPPHEVYCEPFAGGLNVLLNKPRTDREVAGDTNAALVNFWAQLQAYRGFRCAVGHPYDAETFDLARRWIADPHPLTRAVGFLVRNRFSRGGLGRSFAWSDRTRGGRPGDVNAWETIKAELPAIAARVEAVVLNCCDAVQLIESVDGPGTLFYCDPPYHHATRTVRDAYEHEMTHEAHERLLRCLLECRGAVAVSGYRCELYDALLDGWRRVEFEMPNHSGQGRTKGRRIECLWTNYDPPGRDQ